MFFWICFVIAFLPLTLLFPVRVVGKKNLPKKQGFVLTCNHYSNIDAVMLDIKLVRKIRFLSKKELFQKKFTSAVLKSYGGFPVDREKPDASAFKFALKTLKNKKILGIFPEGHRNKSGDNGLQEVKSGAIIFAGKAGVPIVPAVIVRPIKMLKRSRIVIGEPFMVEAENPAKLSKEEIAINVEKLASITNELREKYSYKQKTK